MIVPTKPYSRFSINQSFTARFVEEYVKQLLHYFTDYGVPHDLMSLTEQQKDNLYHYVYYNRWQLIDEEDVKELEAKIDEASDTKTPLADIIGDIFIPIYVRGMSIRKYNSIFSFFEGNNV